MGGASKREIYDTFTRSNGVLGSTETPGSTGKPALVRPWTGGTWTISTNAASNLPTTFGADDITNGEMETGDPPTSWTAVNATLDGVADERTGGSGAQSLSITNSGAAKGYAYQTLDTLAGNWVVASVYAKKITGSAGFGFALADGTILVSTVTASTSWLLRRIAYLLPADSCRLHLTCESATAGHEARFDSVTVKAYTLSELFAYVQKATDDVAARVSISTQASKQMFGGAVRLNSNTAPTAGIVFWADGTNIMCHEFTTAITWTKLITGAKAIAAGDHLILKALGANLTLYHKTAAGVVSTIGTATASVLTGSYCGLFSTYSGQTLNDAEFIPASLISRFTG